MQVTVEVEDPVAALSADAFGPDAVLAWASAPAQAGAWTAGGAVPLVVTQTEYSWVDDAGSDMTWYRWRYAAAGGGSPISPWSQPFTVTSAPAYLTVAEFRQMVSSALPDEAIQTLLDAEARLILDADGPLGSVTEEFITTERGMTPSRQFARPRQLLRLGNFAATITQVVENGVVLASDDYLLSRTGLSVRRLATGAHSAWHWGIDTFVTYVRLDDTPVRKRVQAALVALDLNYQPGLVSAQGGGYAEVYQGRGGASTTYEDERAAILATLSDDYDEFVM